MTVRTSTAVPLTSEQKQVIIAEHGRGPHAAVDTGSSEVQIAMVNKRIRDITEHLKFHKHDHHSRRGLLLLVGRQRRMLNHLADTDVARYRTIIATLGIRNTLKR